MIPVTDLTGLTVMVVDDNADNVEMLSTWLQSCGATVLAIKSGIEAAACLDTQPAIDLLITDVSMPSVNGIELVQHLRRHPAHSTLPAIAVSGFPEKYFATDAQDFAAFLLKPVELEELAAKVKSIVTANSRPNR